VFNDWVIGKKFQNTEVTSERIRPMSGAPMGVRLEEMLP
jgi:hypothetical protein